MNCNKIYDDHEIISIVQYCEYMVLFKVEILDRLQTRHYRVS